MTVYSLMSRSNLIVSTLSSALNEAYGFGKKILFFNYTGTSIYHCDIDPLNVCSDLDTSLVFDRLDELISMDSAKYYSIHKHRMDSVMSYPDDARTFSKSEISSTLSLYDYLNIVYILISFKIILNT